MRYSDQFLSEADPQSLLNIVQSQGQRIDELGQSILKLERLSGVANEIGELDYRVLDTDGNLRMVMSASDLFDELGVHAHFAGLDINHVVQVYISADDGKIYGAGGNVVIGVDGIVLANDANALNFESSTGVIGNTFIYINNNDDLGMFNFLAGKALVLVPQLTNGTHPAVRVKEDPGNANVLQMTMDIATSGSNFTLGGEVVIWAARDGKETVFNDGSYDVDHRWEGATDTNLWKLDAGLDVASIGGVGVGGQKLTVYGKTVVDSGGLDVTNGNVRSTSFALNDDAATSFTPARTIGGIQVTTSGTGNGGIASYNTITPVTGLVVGGANFAVATGSLAGTTGTDTKLTISAHATDGKIYIENRTGATRTIVVLLT